MLPEEINDNDNLKVYGAYKKPNNAPGKLLHENYIRKKKNKSFTSDTLPISDIDSANDVSNNSEAEYDVKLLKMKENSMKKTKETFN